MNEIYELPPELHGSVEQQMLELRDYLLRLALRLNEEAR